MNKESFKYSLILLLVALIWGAAFVAQSMGNAAGPLSFNAARNILAAISLLPILIHHKTHPKPGKNHWNRSIVIGGIVCGVVLAIASNAQQYGLMYASAGKAGFITAMYIVIVPIMGLFMKHKPNLNMVISLVLACIGLYLLCWTNDGAFTIYDGFLLFCAFLYAIHILVIAHFGVRGDAVLMSMIQFLVCGTVTLIAAILFEDFSITKLSGSIIPILYTGILSSGVGYTLQIIGQQHLDATLSSLILSLESVFAVLSGWVLLGEVLSFREIFGCVVMFVAIILAQCPPIDHKSHSSMVKPTNR